MHVRMETVGQGNFPRTKVGEKHGNWKGHDEPVAAKDCVRPVYLRHKLVRIYR